jgi:ABC-type hemin transport system substrate-binding protein
MRIVSLLPSTTEIIYALGPGHHLARDSSVDFVPGRCRT